MDLFKERKLLNSDTCKSANKLTQRDYLIAGSLSGFLARTAVQPLDVVKIRFQLQVEPISHGSTGSKYRGFFQAIKSIIKEEGVRAFWKGHLPAQIQAVSFSAFQFTSFELISMYSKTVRYHFFGTQADEPISSIGNFINGCLAGTSAAIFTQPLDVLRTRFIAQDKVVYRNIFHALKTIRIEEGYHGFFRGLVPSLLLLTPQTGLQFGIYKIASTSLTEFSNDSIPLGIRNMISGGISGLTAKIIVYPLDIAKKRLQVQGFEKGRQNFGKLHVSSNLVQCLILTSKEEGFLGLFKGIQPSILKAGLSVSVRFTLFEEACRILSKSK